MVPLNQGILALRHKFLHLGKDAGRHLPRGKLQPIVFRPGKLADVTLVREDLFKTSVHVSSILFAHRLVATDVLGHAGIQKPGVDSFDSKVVIDVEDVLIPRRSGAEAQQRPHLLGNHLLVGVSQKRNCLIGCGLLRRAIFYAHLARNNSKNQSKTQRILPMRADRFSRVKSSANNRDASTTRGRGHCAADRCIAVTRRSSAVAKSAPLTKHPSLIGYPKRIASLILSRKYRFRNKGRNRPPKNRILHATKLSTKRLLFKGRHHFDGLAHVISILDLVNVIARFR